MAKSKMKVLELKVVRFNTLKNADLFDGTFDSVSYGDAAFTLVGSAVLIAELEEQDDESLAPLIKELSQIPEGVYVALDG